VSVSVDELPSIVKSLNNSWPSTYQTSITVVRDQYTPTLPHVLDWVICRRRGTPALLFQRRLQFPQKRICGEADALSASVQFSILVSRRRGAAVSGLILTNKLRNAPTQTRTPREVLSHVASSHGYEGRLIWVEQHCEYPYLSTFPTPPSLPYIAGVLSVIGGIVLPTVQVLLYVWLEESNVVRFTLSVITLFAMLPIVFVLLPSPGSDKHSIVSS
jgi:hypothetical protein